MQTFTVYSLYTCISILTSKYLRLNNKISYKVYKNIVSFEAVMVSQSYGIVIYICNSVPMQSVPTYCELDYRPSL